MALSVHVILAVVLLAQCVISTLAFDSTNAHAYGQPSQAVYQSPSSGYGSGSNGSGICAGAPSILENVVWDLPLTSDTFDAVWDPYNNNSRWLFRMVPPDLLIDDAAFILKPKNNNNINFQPYGGGGDAGNDVDMVSLPFTQWKNSSEGPVASVASYEAAVAPKGGVTVGPTQKFLARMIMNCKTYNTGRSHFPRSLITDDEDDPRMANCLFTLSDFGNTGVKFSFMLTNKGIWAQYIRDPWTRAVKAQTWQAFDVWRRVGSRSSTQAFVDMSILYDRPNDQVDYYVNGCKVWTINQIGQLPTTLDPARDRVVLLTDGTPQRALPAAFNPFFGGYGPLDRTDPNNIAGIAQQLALIRLTDVVDFYGLVMTFFDNLSQRSNKLWGQGTEQRLHLIQLSSGMSMARTAG